MDAVEVLQLPETNFKFYWSNLLSPYTCCIMDIFGWICVNNCKEYFRLDAGKLEIKRNVEEMMNCGMVFTFRP